MLNILMFEQEKERVQRELNERKRTKGDLHPIPAGQTKRVVEMRLIAQLKKVKL